MFFHILSMICDSDENIVELATYFMHDFLVPINKNIMFEHIIDALFHFNNYKVSKLSLNAEYSCFRIYFLNYK